MIEIKIDYDKYKDFEIKPGQLFVSRATNSCFIFTKLENNKYTLLNINGINHWEGTIFSSFIEAEKSIKLDLKLNKLKLVKNQKIIIEGEV